MARRGPEGENVRKLVGCGLIVALFVLLNVLSVGALAAPRPPSTVTISNVKVDPNSVSGSEARITWSTDPASACDAFSYRLAGTTSWMTIYPACGTHAVALGGLAIFTPYDFMISSSARKYNTGVYTSSFYPVDASLSKAYEGYPFDFWADSVCGRKYVRTQRVAEMPGDVEYDPGQVGNSNHYQLFNVHAKYYGQGESWCWPYQLTTKRTVVRIWVKDFTSGINDWIAANVDPVPNVASGGWVGSVSWSIEVGAELKPASFGVSLSYTPASGISLVPIWHNEPYADGWKYVAELKVDWNGGMQTSEDFSWPMHVIDSLAQYRLYDRVQFMISYSMVFDLFNPSWPWVGYGPWIGYDWTVGATTILGQGTDNNGANNLDQYTNVQMGVSSGPG